MVLVNASFSKSKDALGKDNIISPHSGSAPHANELLSYIIGPKESPSRSQYLKAKEILDPDILRPLQILIVGSASQQDCTSGYLFVAKILFVTTSAVLALLELKVSIKNKHMYLIHISL